MRSIPFEVSAEIINARRHKSRSGLPQLLPILDRAQSSPAVKRVNSPRGREGRRGGVQPEQKVQSAPCLLLQVDFVKEGCGIDNLCRSHLRMEYALFYKQNSQDSYLPLHM